MSSAVLSRSVARKIKGYKAARYLCKVIEAYYPQLRGKSLLRVVARLSPARRSADCRSVRWFGESYTFTPAQALIVAELWDAWENGTPKVGAEQLLHVSDMISDRISELFKRSEAWGVMVRTDGAGVYWLEGE